MPWTSKEAKSHTKKADSPQKQKQWAKIANAALDRDPNDEAGAIRQANAAMDGKFWNDGGEFLPDAWRKVKKATRDSAAPLVVLGGDVEPSTVHMFDTVDIDDDARVHFTRDGYMTAMPLVARTGIQVYDGFDCGKPDMVTVRVFRPAEEVFSKDALRSFTHRPVTVDHPSKGVNSKNWKQFAAGHTGDEILRDGERFRVPMALMDEAAVGAYKAGKKQLSWGYDCDLDWTPGTHDGEPYDAVQRNLRANHLAVVTTARGGPELRIGDSGNNANDGETHMAGLKSVTIDGIAVEMTDTAAAVVDKTIRGLQMKIDAFEKKKKDDDDEDEENEKENKKKDDAIKAKDAELVTLKQQLKDATDPAKLDALVRDRSDVFTKARALVGDGLKIDGKTAEQVRREVVTTKLGDVAKDWDDKQVAASFNTLTAGVRGSGGTVEDAARIFSGRPGGGYGQMDTKDKAYDSYDQSLAEAWRGGGQQQRQDDRNNNGGRQ